VSAAIARAILRLADRRAERRRLREWQKAVPFT
jgi:hypothetical protein